jgi:16S rRNA processing protein RimM
MPATPDQPPYLQVARVLRPHGIRGDLRVQVITSFPERLLKLKRVFVGPAAESYRAGRQALQAYSVTRAHHDKNDHWLIHLGGVDSREAADKLREMLLFVALEEAVPLEENEYYLYQLIGLEVLTVDGQPLGKLIEVLETGANDVFIVRGETYGEVLLPVIDGAIQSVDLEAGQMVMHLPDGLLPDASTDDASTDDADDSDDDSDDAEPAAAASDTDDTP